MTRPSSRFAAFLLLAALLFSQWTVATYACAMPTSAAVGMDADDMAGMDCGSEPETRSLLCVLHCDGDQASGQSSAGAPDLTTWAPLLIVWPVAIEPTLLHVAGVEPPDVRRQTSPPPLLLSRRFRQ